MDVFLLTSVGEAAVIGGLLWWRKTRYVDLYKAEKKRADELEKRLIQTETELVKAVAQSFQLPNELEPMIKIARPIVERFEKEGRDQSPEWRFHQSRVRFVREEAVRHKPDYMVDAALHAAITERRTDAR